MTTVPGTGGRVSDPGRCGWKERERNGEGSDRAQLRSSDLASSIRAVRLQYSRKAEERPSSRGLPESERRYTSPVEERLSDVRRRYLSNSPPRKREDGSAGLRSYSGGVRYGARHRGGAENDWRRETLRGEVREGATGEDSPLLREAMRSNPRVRSPSPVARRLTWTPPPVSPPSPPPRAGESNTSGSAVASADEMDDPSGGRVASLPDDTLRRQGTGISYAPSGSSDTSLPDRTCDDVYPGRRKTRRTARRQRSHGGSMTPPLAPPAARSPVPSKGHQALSPATPSDGRDTVMELSPPTDSGISPCKTLRNPLLVLPLNSRERSSPQGPLGKPAARSPYKEPLVPRNTTEYRTLHLTVVHLMKACLLKAKACRTLEAELSGCRTQLNNLVEAATREADTSKASREREKKASKEVGELQAVVDVLQARCDALQTRLNDEELHRRVALLAKEKAELTSRCHNLRDEATAAKRKEGELVATITSLTKERDEALAKSRAAPHSTEVPSSGDALVSRLSELSAMVQDLEGKLAEAKAQIREMEDDKAHRARVEAALQDQLIEESRSKAKLASELRALREVGRGGQAEATKKCLSNSQAEVQRLVEALEKAEAALEATKIERDSAIARAVQYSEVPERDVTCAILRADLSTAREEVKRREAELEKERTARQTEHRTLRMELSTAMSTAEHRGSELRKFKAEVEELRARLGNTGAEQHDVPRLQQELSEAQSEIRALALQLEQADSSRVADLEAALSEAISKAALSASELEGERQRVYESESALASAEARISEIEGELHRVRQQAGEKEREKNKEIARLRSSLEAEERVVRDNTKKQKMMEGEIEDLRRTAEEASRRRGEERAKTEQEVDELRAALKSAERRLLEERKECGDLRKVLDSDRAEASKRIRQLEEERVQHHAALEGAQQKADKAERQVKNLEDEVKVLRGRVDELRAKRAEEERAVRESHQHAVEAERKADEATQRVCSLELELALERRKAGEAAQRLHSHQQETILKSSKQMEAIQSELEALEVALDQAEEEKASLKRDFDTAVAEMEAEIQEQREKGGQHAREARKLKEELQEVLSRAKEEVAEAVSGRETAEEALREMEQQVAALRTQLESKHRVSEELEAAHRLVHKLESELDDSHATVQRLREEVKQHRVQANRAAEDFEHQGPCLTEKTIRMKLALQRLGGGAGDECPTPSGNEDDESLAGCSSVGTAGYVADAARRLDELLERGEVDDAGLPLEARAVLCDAKHILQIAMSAVESEQQRTQQLTSGMAELESALRQKRKEVKALAHKVQVLSLAIASDVADDDDEDDGFDVRRAGTPCAGGEAVLLDTSSANNTSCADAALRSPASLSSLPTSSISAPGKAELQLKEATLLRMQETAVKRPVARHAEESEQPSFSSLMSHFAAVRSKHTKSPSKTTPRTPPSSRRPSLWRTNGKSPTSTQRDLTKIFTDRSPAG